MPPRFTFTNVGVECLCNQFLAGAVFAHNEHRGVGGGHAAYVVEHTHQCGALADDARAVEIAGGCAAGQFQRGGHAVEEHAVVPGLGDEVECAGLHPFHGKGDAAPCRDEDDGHRRMENLYLTQQRKPFVAGCGMAEVHVEEHKLRSCGSHCRHGIGRSGDSFHFVACFAEQHRQGQAYGVVVVGNKYHTTNLAKNIKQPPNTFLFYDGFYVGVYAAVRCVVPQREATELVVVVPVQEQLVDIGLARGVLAAL